MFERLFALKKHHTTVRTEILAGCTTFFAMAYIIVVNPSMISGGHAELANGIFFATCISSAIGTLLMAFLAKLPFAQAPSMGLLAFFVFTIMPSMASIAGNPDLGAVESYQMALVLVFLAGILFLLTTIFGIREKIVQAIPHNIKLAISGGIGLFIAYLGLQNAGLIVANESTQVALLDFSNWAANSHMIIGALLALFGLICIAVLSHLRVKGAILISIIATTVLSYLCGYSTLPAMDFHLGNRFGDFLSTSFFKLDFSSFFAGGENIGKVLSTVGVMVLSLFLVDMFDSLGTFLGVAQKADLLDKDGNMPRMKQAFLCDSIATSCGALLGTPNVTTYVESSAGIGEGGRTGLTALTTGILFLVALVLAPVIGLVPMVATAPALIFVGALMISGIRNMEFDDMTEALPGFLTIIMMPLSYSISNGIAFGLISYVLIKLLTGKVKQIKPMTVIIAVLFALRYCFIAL